MYPDEEETSKIENVRVFIRIRPLTPEESIQNHFKMLKTDQDVVTLIKPNTKDSKRFEFCKIFDEPSTQEDIYDHVALPIVRRVELGYNGTILAYGQSGTGKTHTMLGNLNRQSTNFGIVPKILLRVFSDISASPANVSHVVTLTFLEIYNEEVRDLLGDSQKNLQVRETPRLGVYVKDLLGFTVESFDHALEILRKGVKNRRTGDTGLNDVSSRSHAIFTVMMERRDAVEDTTTFAKLNLVDLAGSERASKTTATGERLREAGKINLSLSVLGNVISALVDGARHHVPYRNSKLTRLLSDSLGGNSLTAMIATVSPKETDFEETLYTLMYADRVKRIRNTLKRNEDTKSVLKTFETKIKQLRLQLTQLSEMKRVKSSKNERDALSELEGEKEELLKRIATIQKKILVGGVNLLEKSRIQQDQISYGESELRKLDSTNRLLEEILHSKGLEATSVGTDCVSLQEQDRQLDILIESRLKQLKETEIVLGEKENEYQNEIGRLLDVNRSLAEEMRLTGFVVKSFISEEDLRRIRAKLVWDADVEDYRVQGVAYCGNHLRKSRGKDSRIGRNCVVECCEYMRYQRRKKKS